MSAQIAIGSRVISRGFRWGGTITGERQVADKDALGHLKVEWDGGGFTYERLQDIEPYEPAAPPQENETAADPVRPKEQEKP